MTIERKVTFTCQKSYSVLIDAKVNTKNHCQFTGDVHATWQCDCEMMKSFSYEFETYHVLSVFFTVFPSHTKTPLALFSGA